MKQLILPVIVLITALTACGPKKDPNLTYFDKPADYNNYIVAERTNVFNAYDALKKTLQYGTVSEMYSMLGDMKKTSVAAVEKMDKLAPFEKNIDFRDKAKALYSYYAAASDKEIKDLTDIFAKGNDMQQSDVGRVETLVNSINASTKKLDDELIPAQNIFAKKYNLELIHSQNPF
jgi:hypothetical protein